tara:strand:- start:234 stop:725 length:492 start_codon:yes stop_codon:yes gene_type:complete
MDVDVSQKEFEEALNDNDTQRVFGFLSKKYHNISKDDIIECQLLGLWKALKKYDPERKKKFKNFLYTSIDWECKLYLRKNKRKEVSCVYDSADNNFEPFEPIEVMDIVDCLIPRLKIVIKQRFFENFTMEEIGNANNYSRETARRYLKEAIEKLQSHKNRIIR